MIATGKRAPAIPLDSTVGKKLSLRNYRGKNVLLAFFCFCFSPVCTLEFQDFARNYGKFRRLGVDIVGASIDSTWAQRAWSRLLKLPFHLVSDSDKKLARKFGVLNKHGFADRSYFLIDKKGIVRYAFVEKTPLQRHTSAQLLKEIKRVLKHGR